MISGLDTHTRRSRAQKTASYGVNMEEKASKLISLMNGMEEESWDASYGDGSRDNKASHLELRDFHWSRNSGNIFAIIGERKWTHVEYEANLNLSEFNSKNLLGYSVTKND